MLALASAVVVGAVVSWVAKVIGSAIDHAEAVLAQSRAVLQKRTINLATLVRGAQSEVSSHANQRRIEWHIHDPLPDVAVDPGLFRQVLINLLSNAIKYTAQRPVAQIEIGAQPATNGEAIIFVKDNGVGFDMQYAHKLFGVFQRLHRAEEFEGTGIGLANVNRIVQRHGGRAWAEAAVGRGATFYVAVPHA